jgi:hypothetical protein
MILVVEGSEVATSLNNFGDFLNAAAALNEVVFFIGANEANCGKTADCFDMKAGAATMEAALVETDAEEVETTFLAATFFFGAALVATLRFWVFWTFGCFFMVVCFIILS